MRKSYSNQLRLDCLPIEQVSLNLECRDEIVPVLAGLQHLFKQPELRESAIQLIAADVNESTRNDVGREGLDYWQILVLGVVRLGCNLNYDKLQDLCENHLSLRGILNIGQWSQTSFRWQRIRDTLCLLNPTTLEKINQLIVTHGQALHGHARQKVRADSFVVETNIHYPTESGLIWDGVRKLVPLGRHLVSSLKIPGWRQIKHLQKQIKQQVRQIAYISSSKSRKVKANLHPAYGQLLQQVGRILDRARALKTHAQSVSLSPCDTRRLEKLTHWLELTSKVVDTAFRRTQLGETVANGDKLFSLFEPHTQLYRRGKASKPIQFGRLVIIYEDGAGFISHYHLMSRQALDEEVVVEQTALVQSKHGGEIQDASFDRGYFSEENQTELESIVDHPCLPPRHLTKYSTWMKEQTIRIHASRKSHSGIESAIGALQCGNGLKRCRDRNEKGLERYLGLAILGRNVQVLGKLLIARQNASAEAAITKRKAA